MTNLIGQSLGRYHIVEQLGEGGMATVYKAYDTRLERDVAVKIIRVDQFAPAALEHILKRFEREAKALARLTHPNIVHINDFGEHEGIPYLVMDYLSGGTLKERLGQPIPWMDAARLLIPIARALHFAHEQNIIHRDVKPSNILITLSGEPMLTDFGIAKILGEEATRDLTGTSATVGTPEYMAPEQVTSKTVDRRADVYALGIVYYEMVTGRRPFRADTPMAVLFKQASEPLPRPNLFVADLPEAVEKVLFKALAKNPDDRYQTMGEFALAFESLSARQVSPPVEAPAIAEQKAPPVPETQPPALQQEVQAVPPRKTGRETVEPKTAIVEPLPEQPPAMQGKPPAKRRGWIRWAIGGGMALLLLAIGAVVGIPYLIKPTEQIPTKSPVPTISPAPTQRTEPATPVPTLIPPGPGPGGSIPFAAGGKSVTAGWSSEPDYIAPYFTQMAQAIWITQLTQASLGEWDNRGNFIPELAQEIPTAANGGISADGRTITWHLKPNLRWSDGQPLTSGDVKFTWLVIMDQNNAVVTRTGYEKIAGIDTPDDTTVVIHFSELYPPWQTLFTQGPDNKGAILPAHLLQGKTQLETDSFTRWPTISSGPWVIADWVAGDHMTLWPNPLFYKGRPNLDQILIRFVPDPETALAALQAGDIDWYPDFSEVDIATVGALEPAVHLLVVPNLFWEHYYFNLGVKGTGVGQSDQDGFCPFKDVRVRKAITLGIDRQSIVDALLAGKAFIPATQWMGSEWNNTSLRPDPYDPDAAKQLLAEAGYTPGPDGILHGMCNGSDTRLSFNFVTTTRQMRVDTALAVQSDLRKIGIEFKPIHIPTGTFFDTYSGGGTLATGKFDMAGFAMGFYPDPMDGVLDLYACASVASAGNPGGQYSYHLCDPELDRMLADANTTADPAVRKRALDMVQRYIFEKYYVIMMYQRVNVFGYADRFLPGPFGGISGMNWNSELWDVK